MYKCAKIDFKKIKHFINDDFANIVYNLGVKISNFADIKAVAFDIDGTLYENWKLNCRIFPHFFAHLFFFSCYGLVRVELRKQEQIPDFYRVQAELMAKKMKCTPEKAQKKLDDIVYYGLRKYFPRFSPAKGTEQLIKRLKENGVKIVFLSDFPPEQKGEIWGLKKYCDLCFSTEEYGALKPSPVAFFKMAEQLGIQKEEILYVGNNHKYDVIGPKKIGMKAAWFVSPLKGKLGKKSKAADFIFWKYSQLESFIFDGND